jgi:hypothetical protein
MQRPRRAHAHPVLLPPQGRRRARAQPAAHALPVQVLYTQEPQAPCGLIASAAAPLEASKLAMRLSLGPGSSGSFPWFPLLEQHAPRPQRPEEDRLPAAAAVAHVSCPPASPGPRTCSATDCRVPAPARRSRLRPVATAIAPAGPRALLGVNWRCQWGVERFVYGRWLSRQRRTPMSSRRQRDMRWA